MKAKFNVVACEWENYERLCRQFSSCNICCNMLVNDTRALVSSAHEVRYFQDVEIVNTRAIKPHSKLQ